MVARGGFHTELDYLKESIIQLGNEAQFALKTAFEAFLSKDIATAEKVILHDKKINSLELEINEKATVMIARQQPVASDLRKIIVALKVSSDLERIADLAVDVAKGVKRLSANQLKVEQDLLTDIAQMAISMLNDVLIAYDEKSILQAQQIAAKDDLVDKMYSDFIKKLFTTGASDQASIEDTTQLAFIARYLERIADYGTNIAEWIIYEVNGQRFDLN